MKEPLLDDVLENEDIENLLDAGRHQMTDPYVFGLYSLDVTVQTALIPKTDLSLCQNAGDLSSSQYY